MNKKVEKKQKIYDDKEDIDIRNIAHYKNSSQVLLLFILIVLFGFTLFNSFMYIGKYYLNKNKLNDGIETIEIKNNKSSIFINNEGEFNKKIESLENDEFLIERKSSISIQTNNDIKDTNIVKFDVKYNILENSFSGNSISKEDSDIRVRFAYSFDNENWTYVNNVISTYEGTLSPMTDNYYDIAGVVSTLKVLTNYELSSAPGEIITMYLKSETVIKKAEYNVGNNIKASLRIDYKESV